MRREPQAPQGTVLGDEVPGDPIRSSGGTDGSRHRAPRQHLPSPMRPRAQEPARWAATGPLHSSTGQTVSQRINWMQESPNPEMGKLRPTDSEGLGGGPTAKLGPGAQTQIWLNRLRVQWPQGCDLPCQLSPHPAPSKR